jgi:hypothetical protein
MNSNKWRKMCEKLKRWEVLTVKYSSQVYNVSLLMFKQVIKEHLPQKMLGELNELIRFKCPACIPAFYNSFYDSDEVDLSLCFHLELNYS